VKLEFYKYQGTGNDFVVVDNREGVFPKSIELVQKLCNRRFAIGSDGLILIENHDEWDFNMVFYNPDGSQSFCGNGSRCAVTVAKDLGIIDDSATFNSTDGYHEAEIKDGIVSLKMHDVNGVEQGEGFWFINTGSPHYVAYKESIDDLDVIEQGSAVRCNDRFKSEGTNVNFVMKTDSGIAIRTYERGVEGETLSCGTGVTAAALSYAAQLADQAGEIKVKAVGGQLSVRYQKTDSGFKEIFLIGPAEFVFRGTIEI